MNWFVSYIYREANAKLGTSFEPGQNPAVDSLATKIALQTGISNNIAPTQILSLMNQGLGTNYTIADYNRAAQEFGFPTAAVEAPAPAPAAAPAPAPAPAPAAAPAPAPAPAPFADIEDASERLLAALDEGLITEEQYAAGVSRLENLAAEQAVEKSISPALVSAPAPAPSLLAVEETAQEPATSLLAVEEKAPAAQTSLLEVTETNRPQAVLFGDSMSEYVGYNEDGTPDTKYGKSIADVIGANLGIKIENLATGGETSNEALANGSKFGAFEKYITSNKPEYAIIRYGAADAIKNKDPQITLDAVQKMVDIAKANGVKPIIVGVSELYGKQNSKTGNIAGYIDAEAETRANTINDGLKKIAQSAGVSFTDVRSAVSAGEGDLLDGVHSNADFGKKMADAISESIVDVIPEANVPKLPANVDSMSATEKGKLYNDLIAQGYTDAQIRTAAKAESDQDWNALKQVAADVKNVSPAQVEKQAQSAAAQTETAPQTTVTQTAPQTGLLAEVKPDLPSTVMQKAAELLASSGKANNAQYADQPVGSFGEGGKVYSVYGDGSITAITQGDAGDYYYEGFTPEGALAAEEYSDKFKQTPFDKAVGVAANALIAAATAAALGPAGIGLSTPAAAAIGSGATTAITTGDLTQAAKAALLAGAVAEGIETIAPSTATQVAKEATNLASSGASEEVIKQALIEKGVNVGTAANVAADAVAGVPASQIATDIAGITLNQAAATGVGAPNLVEVAGSAAPGAAVVAPASIAGAAASQVPSLLATTGDQVQVRPKTAETTETTAPVGGLLTEQVQVPVQATTTTPEATAPITTGLLAATAPTQTVPVQTQTGTTSVQEAIAPAVVPAVVTTTAAPQTTTVTGQNIPQAQETAGPTGAMLGTTIAGTQTVPVEDRIIKTQTTAPIIPVTPVESVTVAGKKEVPVSEALIPAGAAGAALGVTTPATPVTNNISLMDAATAAMLLSGLGSLLDQGDGGYQMDPDLANRIINAPRPNYGIGVGGGYQMPGMFQIAPTNVYNPFATTAPFGTGRFGGFAAPITLPRGLV